MSRNENQPHERGYWRSLEQLAEDPRAVEFLEREFPAGASEAPEGISRRSMLTLLGASLSMAGLAACRRPVEHIVPYVDPPEKIIPGIPQRYATTMPLGLHAYGLVVESHEGRPTKIEGNEQHPSTLGSSSVWMQSTILGLYDPDRSKRVLEGDAPRSWQEFVAAWKELETAHLADGGAGLAVLSEPFASPTLARLRSRFAERFPKARWVAYEPVSEENVLRGVEAATGAAGLPVPDFDAAEVILSLDCDFLQTEGEPVRDSRGFADGRRVAGGRETMSRLWAVEGVHSVTGANADHRLRLDSGRIGAFAAALAARLGLPVAGGGSEEVAGVDPHWLDVLVEDLRDHRGTSLVLAGRRQPPAVHALVHAINAVLRNVGATVGYYAPEDAATSDAAALAALVGEMQAGTIATLVVLGGNPVYEAPADLDFAGALAGVERVVHLGHYRDETGRAAAWHLPRAHFLEAWGDARAVGGAAGVVQPLIEPLFGAKSDVELLALLATGEDGPGHDRVRETWGPLLGAADFESRWNKLLHDGVQADDAPRLSAPEIPGPVEQPDGAGAGLELVFLPSPAVFDGRWSNNGWLQELPDPLTKMTWGNAALLSPALAAERRIANGDVVRLTLDGRAIELPAWIVPGQADGTVAVPLGYGRSAAGRIGDGVGANAYSLRASTAPERAAGVEIARTGATVNIAQTQDHGAMEGRPIIREATLADYRDRPDFAQHMVEVPHRHSMWEEPSYDEGNQWGMTIDLNACTGCSACTIACQSENNIPVVGADQVWRGREMHWIRVDRYFGGDEADPETVFQALPCMHCENAPCEQVCPVAATVHDEEGLNTMVYNRCIGTRYCSNNCPYKVRRFNYYHFTKDTSEIARMANNPDVTVRSRGVMEKCTYCTQRIQAAKITARVSGVELEDGDVRTACQQACPTRAIEFGNVLDPAAAVSKMKSEPRNYELLEELYTRPRTTYLAKLRNPHPGLARAAKSEGHA